MNDSFVKYLSSRNSDAARASLALYEQVCSDVNPPLVAPGSPCCTQEINYDEYFDKQTVSDAQKKKAILAKTGKRHVLAPDAGRSSTAMSGTKMPQNVCADAGGAST
jgi:hypothetical protein